MPTKPKEAPAQESQALAPLSPVGQIIKSKAKSIQSMLPSHVDSARFMRTIIEVATSPKLLQCSQESIEKSIMDLAYLGLEIGPLGYAYLIPFGNVCQLQIGYKGLVALARRSGEVAKVEAEVVREGDDFDYNKGSGSFLRHKPSFDEKREDKKITHVWAMFTLKDGSEQWDVMDRAQVLKIRDRSQGYQAGKKYNKPTPWDTDEGEMFKKTVLKRVCKLLNLSPQLERAVSVDNESENIVKAEVVPTAPTIEAPSIGRRKPAAVEAEHTDVTAKPEPKPAVNQTTGEMQGSIHEDPEGEGFAGQDMFEEGDV